MKPESPACRGFLVFSFLIVYNIGEVMDLHLDTVDARGEKTSNDKVSRAFCP